MKTKRIVAFTLFLVVAVASLAQALTSDLDSITGQTVGYLTGNVVGRYPTWEIKGVYDWNNDGVQDLMLQDVTGGTGAFGLWFLGGADGTTVVNATFCTYNATASDPGTGTSALGSFEIQKVEDIDGAKTAWNGITSTQANASTWYEVPDVIFLDKSTATSGTAGTMVVWFLGGVNGSQITKTSWYRMQ